MNNFSFVIEEKKLYKEQILVFYDIPLMFTLMDDDKNRYVALCTDSSLYKYIVVKVSNEDIYRMLSKEISMDELFSNAEYKWTVESAEQIEDDLIEKVNKFDLNCLPVPGAMYEICDDSVKVYIDKLINEKCSEYIERIERDVKHDMCFLSFSLSIPWNVQAKSSLENNSFYSIYEKRSFECLI